MHRFSILNLMGVVLAIAPCLAALRSANDYWAGGIRMATPFLLGLSFIGALCGEKQCRSRRLVFAIQGRGYFASALSGPSEENATRLPTTWRLAFVHRQVGPRGRSRYRSGARGRTLPFRQPSAPIRRPTRP